MDRLEYVRMKVDRIVSTMPSEEDRKFAYLHLYGVSQCAIMLAINQHIDHELCGIAGMLHDISIYQDDKHKDHAVRSSEFARQLLLETDLFSEEEINIVVKMIACHSNKLSKDSVYDEVLKDSDVLQHYLYNPNVPIPEREKVRLFYLLEYIENAYRK